jgi:hypothetical protein
MSSDHGRLESRLVAVFIVAIAACVAWLSGASRS